MQAIFANKTSSQPPKYDMSADAFANVSMDTVDRFVKSPLKGQTIVEATKDYEKNIWGETFSDYAEQDRCKEKFAKAMQDQLYSLSAGDAIAFKTIEKGNTYFYTISDDRSGGHDAVTIKKSDSSGAEVECRTVTDLTLTRLKKHCMAINPPFEIIEKAQCGDASAQYQLGLLYRDDVVHVGDSNHSSFLMFEKAAAQGHVTAQFQCGLMRERGIGCKKDQTKALEFFKSAEKQGHALAACYATLAEMSVCVKELKKSLPNAWISFTGRGLVRGGDRNIDLQLRNQMLRLGNSTGRLASKCIQGRFIDIWVECCQTKHAMTEGMVSFFISGMRILASEDYAPAQYQLAMLEGNDDGKYTPEAQQHFEMAARQGYAPAQYQLGLMFNESPGGRQKALEHFEKAAIQGYAPAQHQLHLILKETPDEYKNSLRWLAKAANQHYFPAQQLARQLIPGHGNSNNEFMVFATTGKLFNGLEDGNTPLAPLPKEIAELVASYNPPDVEKKPVQTWFDDMAELIFWDNHGFNREVG